jgi:hypothetical protein
MPTSTSQRQGRHAQEPGAPDATFAERCSDDFWAKLLICLCRPLDSGQVGLAYSTCLSLDPPWGDTAFRLADLFRARGWRRLSLKREYLPMKSGNSDNNR